MILGIDHILIAVENLEQAMDAYRALGFQVLEGGKHPRMGTHNALVPLADSTYLELIGIWDRELAAAQNPIIVAALERQNRLARYVIESDFLDTDVAAMRTRGFVIGDPSAGERERPDGVRVAWRAAFPADALYPFVIQDVTPREVRVPLPTEGIGRTLRIGDVNVGVSDRASATGAYQNLLGVDGEEGWFELPRGSIVLRDVDTELILQVTLECDSPLDLIETWRAGNVDYTEHLVPGVGVTLEPANTLGAPLAMTGRTS